MRQLEVVTPLAQIRVTGNIPGVQSTGAFAYYINPTGATIREALILYPNGGVPDLDDTNLQSKYAENADYYRQRQARKGLEYIGPSLTEGGVRRLVAVLEKNRPDEILFIEDELADAQETAKNAEDPKIKQQAKRRAQQLTRRLHYLEEPLDAEALESELKDIARAQQLAKVPPAILRVMRSMISEVNERTAAMIAHFQTGAGPVAPPEGIKGLSAGASGDRGSDFQGRAVIE
jgi:hypothetical protein